MSITKEEFRKLSTLARLRFSEEEEEEFIPGFDEIIAFADRIDRAVTVSAGDLNDSGEKIVGLSELRADEVGESLPNEKILSNVCGEKGYFMVGQVELGSKSVK